MSSQTRCVSLSLDLVLNDHNVVVLLSLLYQLLARTSWRLIHLFRRHLLHLRFVSRIWAWKFSFIWICFLIDPKKEYRQSPDRYFSPTTLVMSGWFVDLKDNWPYESWSITILKKKPASSWTVTPSHLDTIFKITRKHAERSCRRYDIYHFFFLSPYGLTSLIFILQLWRQLRSWHSTSSTSFSSHEIFRLF